MKNRIYTITFSILLLSFTIYVLLDTFIISTSYQKVENNNSSITVNDYKITNNSYEDKNITINIDTIREYDTNLYIATISLNNTDYLKTAFANDIYGKNVTAKTSEIAKTNNAILAINGDYYGVQNNGYVLKNGVIYRNISNYNKEDLVIYDNGTFEFINESDISLEELLASGAKEILSFGPALIKDGVISVSQNDEVGKSMASNPRTAIGITYDNKYIFVVSDGRTNESTGLSLYELATIMQKYIIKDLYNLDGGGSSTMYFNGNIINNPTTSGRNIKEREVSDIVYIGY